MTHHVRIVAAPTGQRIIDAEHADPRQALLIALGQVPLGYTVASVTKTDDDPGTPTHADTP